MRALALIAVAGCWVDVPPPVAVRAPSHTPAPIVVRPRSVRQVWVGEYTCTQGLTALELTIEQRGGEVSAVFAFGPVDSNPSVPRGSYRMTGTIRDEDAGVVYNLFPVEWIEQPPHYIMVPLVAESSDRETLTGRIRYAGCGALHAHRQ